MSYDLIIRPEAFQDLAKAHDWYEEQRPGLGEALETCVEAALASIVRLPKSPQIIYRRVRRVKIDRFPYGVFYLINRATIVVIAIVHERRDPRIWKVRV